MGTTTYKCFCFHCGEGDASPPKAPPPPKDVGALFFLHAGGGAVPHMDEDGLRRYLSVYQGEGEGTNVGHLLEQIHRLQEQDQRIPRQLFTLDDFHRIVFSHDLNPPIQQRVHHDMTMPLSHYFIYSAHNPYYQARRGSSGRSDESIIRELKMGVRAIELAMWPNTQGDDIIIRHGWTRNISVLLTECLKSIKKYAFLVSPYPVIITLEDNLQSSNLQDKSAKVVLDVLGDILYWPHMDHNGLKELPSPEELKGRVLLSTKPPRFKKQRKRFSSITEGTIEQVDAQLLLGNGINDDDATWGPEVPDFQTEIQSAEKHDGDVSEPQRRRKHTDKNADDNQKELKMKPRKYLMYRHLITFREEKQKSSVLVDALQSEPDKVRLLSWSSQQILEVIEDFATKIVRFTQRNILWIDPSVFISEDIDPSVRAKRYPRGTRFTSSNYNPFVGWVHGAQMVALNMQEHGRPLWLMHGFYRANGGCGYVRKPDFLMQTEPEVFDPRPRELRRAKKTLKVKVYRGEGWWTDFKKAHTSSVPDFWTSVGIAGVPADSTEMKNTMATENTWVPVWEDEFCFDLTAPEIALLRVEVHQYDVSDKDVFGGQTVLPVSELRPGIRAVALFNRQGSRFDNVRLLMRFEFV